MFRQVKCISLSPLIQFGHCHSHDTRTNDFFANSQRVRLAFTQEFLDFLLLTGGTRYQLTSILPSKTYDTSIFTVIIMNMYYIVCSGDSRPDMWGGGDLHYSVYGHII